MSVNVENINKVIEQLRVENVYFNMEEWTNNLVSNVVYPENICGTPSCIGGWAESILRFEQPGYSIDSYISSDTVGEWMGINNTQVGDLFFPFGPEVELGAYEATKEDAIAVLEHLIETGEVSWSKILIEKKERANA